MDNTILFGAVLGACVGLVFSAIGYVMALQSKGLDYLQKMPGRVIMFETPMAPDAVTARLSHGLSGLPVELTATVPGGNRLLFAKKPGLFDWGFFYPVHIAATPSGGAQVQTGIASRAFQWGPLVTKAHQKFVDGVKAAVGQPGQS